MAYYTRTQNHDNNYLDDLRFKPFERASMLEVQLMQIRNAIMALIKHEYLDPSHKVYLKVREKVDANPKKFGVTKNELDIYLRDLLKALGEIYDTLENNEYPPKLLKQGFSVFNDNLYEDVCNQNAINVVKYVKGIVTISKTLNAGL